MPADRKPTARERAQALWRNMQNAPIAYRARVDATEASILAAEKAAREEALREAEERMRWIVKEAVDTALREPSEEEVRMHGREDCSSEEGRRAALTAFLEGRRRG